MNFISRIIKSMVTDTDITTVAVVVANKKGGNYV